MALENAKIVTEAKSTVHHGKQIKMAFDKCTVVKKLENNEKYGTALPLLTLACCSNLPSICTISLLVCIQTVSGPHMRGSDGVDRPVTNLTVAFQDRKIDTAFWGEKLANEMGKCKTGEVYRFVWITLVPQRPNLFKLVSNCGTQVEKLQGAEADSVRAGLTESLVSMSPQLGFPRSDKMQMKFSRTSLSFVSHMRGADISQDNSLAYKCAVMVPCCFIREIRSIGDSASGLPYYHGCPVCKKVIKSDGTCFEHGKVTPNKVIGAAVVIQDPCTTLEATLWKEPLEALRTQFAVGPDVPDMDVLQMLEQKTSACKLVARMAIGINKSGKAHYVDLFDLAPAVRSDGLLAAFHELPSLPGEGADGLAPLCCQHLQRDDMGQLQANFTSESRLIGGAMCMFRVAADQSRTSCKMLTG